MLLKTTNNEPVVRFAKHAYMPKHTYTYVACLPVQTNVKVLQACATKQERTPLLTSRRNT